MAWASAFATRRVVGVDGPLVGERLERAQAAATRRGAPRRECMPASYGRPTPPAIRRGATHSICGFPTVTTRRCSGRRRRAPPKLLHAHQRPDRRRRPAALEAALALHRLAGDRVATTLLAPSPTSPIAR